MSFKIESTIFQDGLRPAPIDDIFIETLLNFLRDTNLPELPEEYLLHLVNQIIVYKAPFTPQDLLEKALKCGASQVMYAPLIPVLQKVLEKVQQKAPS